MRPVAVVDSGVWIAAADANDPDHARCAGFLASAPVKLVTPTLCIAEACHFIADRLGPESEAAFLDDLQFVEVLAPGSEDWSRIAAVVRGHAGFRLGATDASVVVLAEDLRTDLIATLDHRHFRAIKPRHCDFFRLLPEL